MGKSKKKQVVKTASKSNFFDELIEKIVQQTLGLIVSFIFTTMLIGGSGYVLFQFPTELNATDPDSLELEVKQEQLETLNKILEITNNGWLFDSNEIAKTGEITKWMSQNIRVEKIENDFYLETTNWTSQALLRIAFERGEINGYKLDSEIDQNLQNSIVHEYDLRIEILRQMEDLFRYWNGETTEERIKRLEVIQTPIYDSIVNLSEIEAKYNQLEAQKELELKKYQQKVDEINTKKYVAFGKLSLSIVGIIIGISIFYALGKATLKKLDQS